MLFIATAVVAQTRDPNAIAVLQSAVAAMGGPAAVNAIQDCTASGTIAAALPTGNVSGTFSWKWSGGQFNMSTNLSDHSEVLVTGHGNAADQVNGTVEPLLSYVTDAELLPHLAAVLLEQALTNANYSITFQVQASSAGSSVSKIVIAYAPDPVTAALTQQTWFISTTTNLPVHVEYRLPGRHDPTDLTPAAVDLANYQVVSGVAVPTQITFSVNGQVQSVATISSVAFNTGLPASMFDLPGGAQ